MKKKYLLLALLPISLVSCAKTELLYKENAYNSPIFDENYYTSWDGIKDVKIRNEINGIAFDLHSGNNLDGIAQEDNFEDYAWVSSLDEKDKQWGYHNNLDSIEEKFNYGILSKLYDGRVRCDGLYQKSRVQLNKTGYATYFPKSLVESKFIAFACRGGSTLPQGTFTDIEKRSELSFNFELSFYIHISGETSYDKITYSLNDIMVQTDNGGNTSLVSFYLGDTSFLNGAVAMSLEWECNETELMEKYNFTDNYQDKEKDHMALMLYEVFIGKSTWF